MSKVNTETIYQIREEFVNGSSQSALAKQFNLSKKSIYRIVNLISYPDIAIPDFYNHRLHQRRTSYKKVKPRKPIILIGERKRQGKDTFALFLKEQIENKGYNVNILHFADALKEIVAEMLNLTVEELDELKNNENKKLNVNGKELTYRELLVNFGNGKIKQYFGKDVWKRIVLKKIDFKSYTIIPDFRFIEEYISGSFTIKIEREINKSKIKGITWDYIVKNDKGLEELKQKAIEIADEIV